MTERPIDEATIAALADGELPAAEAARLAAEAAADPELAERIARARALRSTVSGAFQDTLAEPIPDRLMAAIGGGGVIDLSRARAARQARAGFAPAVRWGALAAGLALAFVAGRLILPPFGPPAPIASGPNGSLVAQGVLASGLEQQLASSQAPDAPLKIGVSFRDQAGDYCRTFVLRQGAPVGGLACRQGGGWRVEVAQAASAPTAQGPYQTAVDQTPPAVLSAMDQMIAGAPLGAAAERAARDGGWPGKKP